MAVASMPRQPFAELDSSRLQSLSSTKNRQNALTELLASSTGKDGKDNKTFGQTTKYTLTPPTKRPFSPSLSDDENEDAENIAPVASPSKRSKNLEGLATSPKKQQSLFPLDVKSSKQTSAFSLSPTSPTFQRGTPAPFTFPSPPASAPAGRLPKPKRVGALLNKRSSLSPYKRIDPPSFRSSKNRAAGLPFSLDAAISGTVSKSVPSNPKSSKATNLRESMPTSWLFDIHEDTPDEEAAIMMEHSTCTLDISSDDEAGPSSKKDDRGKENIPPPDMATTAAAAAAPESPVTPTKPRRSIDVDAMTDEGEERSPLGTLPAEDFYSPGLDKDSVQVVAEAGEATTTEERHHEEEETVRCPDEENIQPVSENSPVLPDLPSMSTGSIDVDKPDFVIAED